jgi:hypothetical protein
MAWAGSAHHGLLQSGRTPSFKGLSVGTLMDHGRNFTALVRKNMQDQKSLGKIETNDCDERRGIVYVVSRAASPRQEKHQPRLVPDPSGREPKLPCVGRSFPRSISSDSLHTQQLNLNKIIDLNNPRFLFLSFNLTAVSLLIL